MLVSASKTAIANLIGGAGPGKVITHIGFGTNGNAPSPNDTALTDAFIKPIGSVSYPAPGRAAFSWTLEESEAVGKTIRERGLLCSDGSLFSRKVHGAIEKDNEMALSGTWTITF